MNTRGRHADGVCRPCAQVLRKRWSMVTVDTTSANEAQTLDQVVIRFAGDSGDGMQLVGDRFTELSAAFGNDLATLPNFPAEIRAPGRHDRGRVVVPGPHLRPRHRHAGRRAQRARGDEPGRAKANMDDISPGTTLLINSDAFDAAQPRQGRLRENPLEDGSLDAFNVYPVPMTSITVEATKELGVKPRDAERSKNFFALGLLCWMYTRPTEADDRVDREAVREQGDGARGQPRGVPCRPQLRRDRRAVRPPLRGRARAAARGQVPQHHRQPRAVVRPRSPPRRRRSCRSSTRRTRSRRRPTSSTSCRSTRTSV